METEPTVIESTETNSNIVKSEEDSPPPPENGRKSPPPNCAICLGTCKNKSFTDSCLHQFCFKCLLTWSKVKAECPLCKQNFKSIIHNVRSNNQYEEYMVEQQQQQAEDILEGIELDNFTGAPRRFRYRTTLTLPRSETATIRQLLMQYPMPMPVSQTQHYQRRVRSSVTFRRTVYRHNLWARPLPDFTGRFRDCRPDFFRYNASQIHRLVPWINRELHYLLNENVGHISYVISKIVDILPQYHITSSQFKTMMRPYLGERTEHFLHELYCFASTPYDMTGYDRYVQYTTDSRVSALVNEVISSSDSDSSAESDIVVVSESRAFDPPAGPSRPPVPVYPPNYIPPPPVENVIPIETISNSDTDDDSSEVMVVGYIKPPQERTPEVVDLLGSDSDVVLQENVPPEPVQGTSSEGRPNVPLVKLSLKRAASDNNWSSEDDDSDDSTYTPPPPRRRRQRRRSTRSTRSPPTQTPPFSQTPPSSYTPPIAHSSPSSRSFRSARSSRSNNRCPSCSRSNRCPSCSRSNRCPSCTRSNRCPSCNGSRTPRSTSSLRSTRSPPSTRSVPSACSPPSIRSRPSTRSPRSTRSPPSTRSQSSARFSRSPPTTRSHSSARSPPSTRSHRSSRSPPFTCSPYFTRSTPSTQSPPSTRTPPSHRSHSSPSSHSPPLQSPPSTRTPPSNRGHSPPSTRSPPSTHTLSSNRSRSPPANHSRSPLSNRSRSPPSYRSRSPPSRLSTHSPTPRTLSKDNSRHKRKRAPRYYFSSPSTRASDSESSTAFFSCNGDSNLDRGTRNCPKRTKKKKKKHG